MNLNIFESLIKRSAQIAMGSLIIYLILANTTPFGVSSNLSSDDTKSLSKLGPGNRVGSQDLDGKTIQVQEDDLVYFTSVMPFEYDRATAKIDFINPYPDQDLFLGFQDKDTWHYQNQLLDSPLLDSLEWNRIGNGPFLFQRNHKYDNMEEFWKFPPQDKVVGTFDSKSKDFIDYSLRLSSYSPSSGQTVIDTPIRGSQTIYAYLENEPFKMQIEKQDLNWYEDPDTLSVKIFKGEDLVYQVDADDDGITDASRKLGQVQKINISNPGPELPEAGVYRIEISGSDDVITRKITTNISKLVWRGPIYLVSNAEIYPGVVSLTEPNTIYTSSLDVSAKTFHAAAFQDISVGTENIALGEINRPVYAETPGNVRILIPKSDVILNGTGFFVFSKDQFFLPSSLNSMEIESSSDLERVDYLLTDYEPKKSNPDGSKTAIIDFDLSSAKVKNGKLSWLIMAPGLKTQGREIPVKKIQLDLFKKGWLAK